MTTAVRDVSKVLEVIESVSEIPNIYWISGDDLCDCIFQRIGDWTNPYLGRTLRVRMCCLWAELYKQYPQFVQEIPAYYDQNRHKWEREPAPWDSEEMDMPIFLWHRQLAKQTGKTLDEIRLAYSPKDRPKKVAVGTGAQSRQAPTEEELEYAHTEQLKAGGWIVDEFEVKGG